ncbi:hypothetical protein [Nocardia sp. BMG51109]|uniref:hypothetical protein n=1 Tax=Nocardia sp. BMG51109 TaxID=1056816 RepID=UPI00056B59B5|nr:hypothetical protein [Nocardia sp. BMG51109]
MVVPTEFTTGNHRNICAAQQIQQMTREFSSAAARLITRHDQGQVGQPGGHRQREDYRHRR